MKPRPLAAVKARLGRLVDQVAGTDEAIVITRNGWLAAVLVRPDEHESWRETRAIGSDRECRAGLIGRREGRRRGTRAIGLDRGLMTEIRRGRRPLKRGGKLYTLEERLPER